MRGGFVPLFILMKHIIVYTDGACKGNPGPGGWAAILNFNNTQKILSGGEHLTTNNRMELMGAIEGLAALKQRCIVDLYTDSKYVKDGCEQWMHTWVKNAWKTSTGLPVRNQDLWTRLYELYNQHKVNLFWIKGHSGDPLNEQADLVANQAITTLLNRRVNNE